MLSTEDAVCATAISGCLVALLPSTEESVLLRCCYLRIIYKGCLTALLLSKEDSSLLDCCHLPKRVPSDIYREHKKIMKKNVNHVNGKKKKNKKNRASIGRLDVKDIDNS